MRLTHRQITFRDAEIHVVQNESFGAPPVMFLHGWPQTAAAFEPLMQAIGPEFHALAIDLPGIGRSRCRIGATKSAVAGCVRDLIETLGLRRVTLVGHDIGGQVVLAYLVKFPNELERAVIMNVVVPGIEPWDRVLRNPRIWHFAFHNVPELPERLVMGRQRTYFDWFYDALATRPGAISEQSRQAYAAAYAERNALTAGFEWYRAFAEDAEENARFACGPGDTHVPVLYVRGDGEPGKIDEYVAGLQGAGLTNVVGKLISNCGHFAPEERPGEVWRVISDFCNQARPTAKRPGGS
jgi:pimeloyl-ACP methyl ester carboxylesterase